MLICHDRGTGTGCGAENTDTAKHCQKCGLSLRYALELHNPNTIVGAYRIVRVIGYGGFGAVYEAEDTRSGEHVALKETFNPANIRSFQSEFNVLHRLDHDHLPRYYEMFEEQGNGYLVMELIPGQSLLDVLQRRGDKPLAEEQVLGYAIQICGALSYLHQQHPPLIHRDIKPANIRLTPDGLIKLVDFGLLKQGTDKTGSSRMGLTPHYAPLEQWGVGMHTTPQSDLYSLGATLYHLITGQLPIPVTNRLSATNDPLLPPRDHNPRISPHVADAIMRAMEVHEQNRFADATAFKQALLSAAATTPAMPAAQLTVPQQADPAIPMSHPTQPSSQTTQPVSQPTVPVSQPTVPISQPSRSRPPMWAIITAVVVVLAIVGVLVSGVFSGDNGRTGGGGGVPTEETASVVVAEATSTATMPPPATATMPPTATATATMPPPATATATMPPPATATMTPTATATPTPTPRINALYPVTLDEWRDEMAQLSTTFTREGDHYWRFVPGGTYTIGGWLDDDDEENDGQADITLPDYWVAKHPITVQQYRQFIDAGGYTNQQYWTPTGWQYAIGGRANPEYWGNERFMADNQAVVGIYWYDAVAYANWLQSELGDTLPEGTCLRIPTEAEWEVMCAYGADGQRYSYPWGNDEPTSSLADYGRSIETDNPMPVGRHPAGAAPSGVQDIVGGGWENLSTGYSVYPEASDVVVDDFTRETWDSSARGPAWYSDSRYVRCGSRDDDPIDNAGFFYEGIRVVISDCE